MSEIASNDGWSEADSENFIDYGRYYVPEREQQIETICSLIPDTPPPSHVVELCCGEGLLSHALLERLPNTTVHAFDGSPKMLAHTAVRLAQYGDRFDTTQFDLAASDWRAFPWPLTGVVSSLAIHHLDGPGKAALFADVARALAPGGVFVVADLVEPTSEAGRRVAAKAWDDAVRQRALELDGDLAAFETFQADDWNHYSAPEPDPVDMPSPLKSQLDWMAAAGLVDIDVHYLKAGHAIFSGRKA